MEFVTDRTLADVQQGTAKGSYSYEDLNRVESAVKKLSRLAAALDVYYEPITKTDWAERPGVFSADTWPTISQMQRYLQNVSDLCTAIEIKADLPRSMEDLDWQGANRIEEALQAVDIRVHSILQAFQYSGELFAGEECCI